MSQDSKGSLTQSVSEQIDQHEKNSPEFDLWLKTVKQQMIASLRRRGSVV